MASTPNPYQPPATQVATGGPFARNDRQRRRRWLDLLTLSLLALASGGYLAFIGILFDSSPVDRIAGYLFLVNVPLLAAWMVQLRRRHRWGFQHGVVVVATQLVIMLAMISMGIGSVWQVLQINVGIAIGFALLAMQCYWVLRIADAQPLREVD